MLDNTTLRVVFGLIALCVLLLCYAVTYRSTRSAYSRWWCLSLLCIVLGAVFFVASGAPRQLASNPLGNAAGVLSAACIWASGRSLGGRDVRWWWLGFAPGVALALGLFGDRDSSLWSGTTTYLAGTAILIGASTWELVRVQREGSPRATAEVRFAVWSMVGASALVSGLYGARAVAQVALGTGLSWLEHGVGTQVSTLVSMLMLVAVTFSMSMLSHEQLSNDLHVRATRDGLTGLLNRTEFQRAAQDVLDGRPGPRAAVIFADLDRFKVINDGFGHAAGDRALTAFADACVAAVGSAGIVGRLGGDEFILLVDGPPADAVTDEISERYSAVGRFEEFGETGTPPTVSFGIAEVAAGDDISLAMARADEALYRAKTSGRARALRYDDPVQLVAD